MKKFIDQKAPQLAFYVRGFWDRKIPFSELELFFWDTMEEWNQHKFQHDLPYSQKERVFWHVLHQTHYWPEQTLLTNQHLIDELSVCLTFLQDEASYCPLDCIGIRP